MTALKIILGILFILMIVMLLTRMLSHAAFIVLDNIEWDRVRRSHKYENILH